MSARLVRVHLGHATPGHVRVTAWTPQEVVVMSLTAGPANPGQAIGTELPGNPVDEHLAVMADRSSTTWLPIADVVLFDARTGIPHQEAVNALVRGVVHRPEHCSLSTREGTWRFTVRSGTAGDVWLWLASFAHAWIVSGRDMAMLGTATLRVGKADIVVASAEASAQL